MYVAVTIYLPTILQMCVPFCLNPVLIAEPLTGAVPGSEQIPAVLQSRVHLMTDLRESKKVNC